MKAGKDDLEGRMPNTPEKSLSESDALLAIQELMDGVEWTPDTLDEIAAILVRAGYRVRDLNDVDADEPNLPEKK